MLPSICARQAAGCAARCTERSLEAGNVCEEDPLALESSRYLACIAGCQKDALACAVAEG